MKLACSRVAMYVISENRLEKETLTSFHRTSKTPVRPKNVQRTQLKLQLQHKNQKCIMTRCNSPCKDSKKVAETRCSQNIGIVNLSTSIPDQKQLTAQVQNSEKIPFSLSRQLQNGKAKLKYRNKKCEETQKPSRVHQVILKAEELLTNDGQERSGKNSTCKSTISKPYRRILISKNSKNEMQEAKSFAGSSQGKKIKEYKVTSEIKSYLPRKFAYLIKTKTTNKMRGSNEQLIAVSQTPLQTNIFKKTKLKSSLSNDNNCYGNGGATEIGRAHV